MRNGNFTYRARISSIARVLTVPMRNGNPSITYKYPSFTSSSYRTYEEWKLRWHSTICTILHVLTVPMRNGNNKSLKRRLSSSQFLPYLWGMETLMNRLYLNHCSVLTVPMRNGNPVIQIYGRQSIRFLPYLWGMETILDELYERYKTNVLTVPMRNGNRTYPYRRSLRMLVLTVPMRNGNSLMKYLLPS